MSSLDRMLKRWFGSFEVGFYEVAINNNKYLTCSRQTEIVETAIYVKIWIKLKTGQTDVLILANLGKTTHSKM